ERGNVEGNELRPGLRIREAKPAMLEIHMVPLQRQDLADPAAREDEEANRSGRRSRNPPYPLQCPQRPPHPSHLSFAPEPLARSFREALNVTHWIRGVPAKAPTFAQVEHLREESERSVRLVWRRLEAIAQPIHVTSIHIRDLPRSKSGAKEVIDEPC